MKLIKHKIILLLISVFTIVNIVYADEIIIKDGDKTIISLENDLIPEQPVDIEDKLFGATSPNTTFDDRDRTATLHQDTFTYDIRNTTELDDINIKMTQDDTYYYFQISGNLGTYDYNGCSAKITPIFYKEEINSFKAVEYNGYDYSGAGYPYTGSSYWLGDSSTITINGVKVENYADQYQKKTTGDTIEYEYNGKSNNGDKYFISGSLRPYEKNSSGNPKYLIYDIFPYIPSSNNGGSNIGIVSNSSTFSFKSTDQYDAKANVKVKIKKTTLDDYRYMSIVIPQASSVTLTTWTTSGRTNTTYNGISILSQSIDLNDYIDCEHEWTYTLDSEDSSKHKKTCSLCEWETEENHSYTYEYDGLTNNLCICKHPKKVKITSNINGTISGTAYTVKTQTLNSNTAFTKYDNPTKTGYIFKNYKKQIKKINGNLSETSTPLKTTNKGTVDLMEDSSGENSIIYTAQYDPIKYNIKFNSTNNKGLTISLSGISNITDAQYDTEYNNPSVSATGYIFKGWTTTSGSSTVTVASGTKLKNLTTTDGANVNLYPVFEAIKYKIVFKNDTNITDKTLEGTIVDLENCEYGTKYKLTANLPLTGYTFKGWTKTKGSSTTNYDPLAEVQNLTTTNNATITLYPVYKANKYTIHYSNENNLGATINLNLSDISNCEYDKEYSISSPVIAHYVFKGWTTTKGGSEVNVTTKAKNLSSTDGTTVNLYPVLENNYYTFHFSKENNLNLDISENIEDMKCNSYTKYNLPDNVDVIGHTFIGWGLATSSNAEFSSNAEIYNYTSEEHKEITLYPLYRTNKYKIHFNDENNMFVNLKANINDLECEYNTKYYLPKTQFTNYIFQGWTTIKGGKDVEFEKNKQIINLTAIDNDIIDIYPVFDYNYYIFHFSNENNMKFKLEGNIEDLKCYTFTKYILPNNIEVKGYIFDGWSLATNSNIEFTKKQEIYNYTYEYDQEFTLYPHYTPISYIFKYSNENTQNITIENIISEQDYIYDNEQSLKDNIEINGYEFKGWTTKKNSDKVELLPNESIFNYTDENNKIITLYPIYEPAQFKIVYTTDTGSYSNNKNSITKEYSITTSKSFEMPQINDIEHYNKYNELTLVEKVVFDKYIDENNKEYSNLHEIIDYIVKNNILNSIYNLQYVYHYDKQYQKVAPRDSGSGTDRIPKLDGEDTILKLFDTPLVDENISINNIIQTPTNNKKVKTKDIVDLLNEIYNDYIEQNNIENNTKYKKDIINYLTEIYIDYTNHIQNNTNQKNNENNNQNKNDVISFINEIYSDFNEQNNINEALVTGFTNSEIEINKKYDIKGNIKTATKSNLKVATKVATFNNTDNQQNQQYEENVEYINKVFKNYNDNKIINELIEKLQNRDYKGIYSEINAGKYNNTFQNFLKNYKEIFNDLKIEFSKNKYKIMNDSFKNKFKDKKYEKIINELQEIANNYDEDWNEIKTNYNQKEYEYLLRNINIGKYKDFLNECINTITKKEYKPLLEEIQDEITEGEYTETFYDLIYYLLDITYKYNNENKVVEIIETEPQTIEPILDNGKEKNLVPLYVGAGILIILLIVGVIFIIKKIKNKDNNET